MTQSRYQRRPTTPVFVGQLGIGGNFPIRVQSMLSVDTKKTVEAVAQIQALINAGCELVRLTVPTHDDVKALAEIRRVMQQKKLRVPLVADVHFSPSIALEVVPHVEKVRINPGNFVDKTTNDKARYHPAHYQNDLDRLEEKFVPLVEQCRSHGVAMRLGTNHGSLSGRIMSRFGDTPEGMVESALDFVRIAHKHNYHDIILSMKASNVRVMVQAYRLLVVKLDELQLPLPFHLGVTEAGDAEEGRIKSSAGIGTLLEDGIGDTIRVSLTEDPVNEIAVAHLIATPYNQRFYSASFSTAQTSVQQTPPFSASSFKRRTSSAHIIGLLPTGGPHNVSVWTRIDSLKQYAQALQPDPFGLAFEGIEMESGHSPAFPSDFKKELRLPISLIANEVPPLMEARFASKLALLISSNRLPLLVRELMEHAGTQNTFVEFCFSKSALDEASLSNLIGGIKKLADSLRFEQFGFSLQSTRPNRDYRLLTMALSALDLSSPVHLRWCQTDLPPITDASAQLGALLIDGIGDSLQIDSEQSLSENLNFCYSLLQACRVRISKTEYISCPSCGRTQFDLQAVLAKIKARTAHLKGLKLGVMGCIVNGPGEMADADFGYVGMGTGKVCLYVGQTCVERNIPEDCALDKLIALIKQEGKWGKDY